MINSPEVCLGIIRQHAQVWHKNINIFSYKIIYAGLSEWKTMYSKRFTT
jgi:hypothetical protein